MRGHHLPQLSALVVLLLSSTLFAGQRPAAEYITILEGAERVARMQVPRVIETLDMTAGMKVVDLGAGSGLFTVPMAESVGPAGVAYAIDIDAELLAFVDRRARQANLANIRTVLAPTDDPKIPEPVDLVLICDTLHHIDNRVPYIKTLARYVKPGGRVAIIDFDEQWPQGHESMVYSQDQLSEWMADAGFTRVSSHDYLENAFFVIYKK